MGRIFFFLGLALIVYFAWRVVQRGRARSSDAGSSSAARRPALAMVSCANCGLHLPRPDAFPEGDHFYCCEDHRARGPVPR
ncbi:MAG: PP0621 family protein [Burkholderiaceae bacterium]